MRMLCYKCRYSWNYKGKNTEGRGYITCPGCLYKIRVDKALIEGPSKQELLTNLPNRRLLPKKLPIKLPTTTSFIEIEDGIFVEKKIAKQFKEALDDEEVEETPIPDGGVEEHGPVIRILPPKFEIIRMIPRDSIKILEHQRSF